MYQIILLIHVLAATALIALVLIQHGKGADIGASFGAGSSHTVFGSQGASSFLFKITGLFAVIFFITSLTLGYLVSQQSKQHRGLNLTEPTKIEQKITKTNNKDKTVDNSQ